MTTPSTPRISEDELDLDPTQALGVALSVQAGSMLMWEAQDRAPAMLAHLQAMGYDVVPVAAARSAPAAGLDAAWAEAEAALPEGWRITGLDLDLTRWMATAERIERQVLGGHMPGNPGLTIAGTTPAAALLALADELREPKS